MKGAGMLLGNFELNPYRRPIWSPVGETPKREHVKTETNENTVSFNDGKDIIIEYFYPY